MTSLILSTGNVVSGGPSIIKKPGTYRSNSEFTSSLRSNFAAAQQECAPELNGNGHDQAHLANPIANGSAHLSNDTTISSYDTSTSTWTYRQGHTLYIPRIDWTAAGLEEQSTQYEITAKLFFLPGARLGPARSKYATIALELVLKELGVSRIDLLIVSFPGMSFEGDCEWEADKINANQGDDLEEQETWTSAVQPLQKNGLVQKLGVAEFGSVKLARFLEAVKEPPKVDQINIRNCCSVPPPLIELAKRHNIELLVHSDCTNILPMGTLRELLGQGPYGAGVLIDGKSPAEHNGQHAGLRGDLTPEWVIKYTAVVKDRGVIENKGYFAGAHLSA